VNCYQAVTIENWSHETSGGLLLIISRYNLLHKLRYNIMEQSPFTKTYMRLKIEGLGGNSWSRPVLFKRKKRRIKIIVIAHVDLRNGLDQ